MHIMASVECLIWSSFLRSMATTHRTLPHLGDYAWALFPSIPLCYTAAPGSGAAVPDYCATEGDLDDEGQGAGASALALLSRREKIACDTGILREMG
jgi:hypothetical protein